jgi:hypothetical protein
MLVKPENDFVGASSAVFLVFLIASPFGLRLRLMAR